LSSGIFIAKKLARLISIFLAFGGTMGYTGLDGNELKKYLAPAANHVYFPENC
jgi:hypothetical protein